MVDRAMAFARVSWLTLSACIALWPEVALAYRPFDGTDAAVADVGEIEVELQPAGARHTDSQKTLIAPATVINYGFAKHWELVLESQLETPLSPPGASNLTSSGIFLKHVLRPGTLQDQSGPSVATEFGVLLPDTLGPTGTGFSVAGIVSQRWGWGTAHLNVQGVLTRSQNADVFTSLIVEGPSTWTVRPVAELAYEEEFRQVHTASILIGAIWQVRDALSFDVAFRRASANGVQANEVRAGLTFGFSLTSLSRPSRK
jgi:hypothetical protein